jgi:hypothetical protein
VDHQRAALLREAHSGSNTPIMPEAIAGREQK